MQIIPSHNYVNKLNYRRITKIFADENVQRIGTKHNPFLIKRKKRKI